MSYTIFVSHNSADRPWVEWLAGHAGRIGMVTYLFEHDPQPGMYISEKVKQQIRQSDALGLRRSREIARVCSREVTHGKATEFPIRRAPNAKPAFSSVRHCQSPSPNERLTRLRRG